jgi:hypothetical protein
VTAFRPDIVIIEALWVVPEKFDVLKRLHPNVNWFVHLHSHIPFLALEGIAMDWVSRYSLNDIGIIANSRPSYEALGAIMMEDWALFYLPNVYRNVPRVQKRRPDKSGDTIDIGCFGAMRPLKNHLLQAIAAIRYAQERRKNLRFHINSTRMETGGEPVLKNLEHLFAQYDYDLDRGATLVMCPWMEPDEFINYLQKNIDIGMQVSLSETFNVVCADYVTAGLPVVVSKEISWVSKKCHAQDDSVDDIVWKLAWVDGNEGMVRKNQKLLAEHSARAIDLWIAFVNANH